MAGVAGSTERRFFWAFVIVLVILLGVGVTSYESVDRTTQAADWRDHAREVLAEAGEVFAAVMDVESAQRGYVILGDERYLDPYHLGIAAAPRALEALQRLTQDNLSQQARVKQLQIQVASKLDHAREVVETRRRDGFAAAQVLTSAGDGKRLTDSIRVVLRELEHEEHRLLREREAAFSADSARTSALVIGGNALALVVVAVSAFLMIRNAAALRTSLQAIREEEWLQGGLAGLAVVLREERPVAELSRAVLDQLGARLGAAVGALYRRQESDGMLHLVAGLALDQPRRVRVAEGETLVGEAARLRRMIELTQVPADYLPVVSGVGAGEPRHLLVVPLLYRNQVEGVLELAWLQRVPASHRTFLERAGESIAVARATARSLGQIRTLLTTAQQQEEELRAQQEELTQINQELEEQSTALIERSRQAEDANRAIEAARQDLQRQAEQLALTSKYKSEFLSNMSHELRTPLNSLLILSQQLYENPQGNLSEKQVRYARTINSSGNDLLTLINDILDLAKIESGTVVLDPADVRLGDLCDDLDRGMRPLAEQKEVELAVRLGAGIPAILHTDGKRLHQVLKNLLSNAIKFTGTSPGRRGSVGLSLDMVEMAWSAGHAQSGRPALSFAVSDNGIGIAPDKQALVFEAFQQADGGVSRRFGGTGLGLSISRELARLLGGELRLVSTLGEGSTFTLLLPVTAAELPVAGAVARPIERMPTRSAAPMPIPVSAIGEAGAKPALVEDDRAQVAPGDRVVLIVEDDQAFARILVDLAREQGFKAVVSLRGGGVPALARELKPDAITLDIHLADGNGWHLLDRLKHDPHTRHIPVHVITVDDERGRALRQGALGALTKPATRQDLAKAFAALMRFRDQQKRHLLVIEDDEVTRQAIIDTVGNGDVVTTAVGDGEAALAALARQAFDCIVLDLGLPGMSGQHLLDAVHDHPQWREIPVIIYTARDLSSGEEQTLRRAAKTIVLKTVASLDRLLDETALFLHRVHSRLPEAKRQRIERVHQADSVLSGRTVLVADDDVRNVFALTSLLERYGMNVVVAENGREALARLKETGDVSLVLMDVMMPEMDGYAAMRAIRAEPQWQHLPVLALTAKAMKGDREQCLAAGASDYITKPVDSDQLLSMLRVWLYR